jgi:hypothetical protein
MKFSALSPALAAGVFLLIGGCQNRTGVRGYSSVETLEPPNVESPPALDRSARQPELSDDYSPSYLKGEVANPVYPPDALAAHAGKYVVCVTVTIDELGRVSSVDRNMRGFNLPNAFSEEFLESVRTSVLSWRFIPAHKIYWSREPGGELKYVGAEPVVSTMDFKFTFDVSGAVRR